MLGFTKMFQPQPPRDPRALRRIAGIGGEREAEIIIRRAFAGPLAGYNVVAEAERVLGIASSATRIVQLHQAISGRGPARDASIIFRAENLPLMTNPCAPEYPWHRQARVLVQNAFAAQSLPDRARLRELARLQPDRIWLQLIIGRPLGWDGQANLRGQLVPVLAGLVQAVLDLPPCIIGECLADQEAVRIFTAMRTPFWSAVVRADGEEHEKAVA
jgi:hypothetical protein